MIVRLLKTMAGPEGVWYPGDQLHVSKLEGVQLLTSGSAELIEDDRDEIERAIVEDAIQTAEAPQARRRGRPAIGKGK